MSRRGRAVYNRKKLVTAALAFMVLSGCGAEALPETVEVEEIPAPAPGLRNIITPDPVPGWSCWLHRFWMTILLSIPQANRGISHE